MASTSVGDEGVSYGFSQFCSTQIMLIALLDLRAPTAAPGPEGRRRAATSYERANASNLAQSPVTSF